MFKQVLRNIPDPFELYEARLLEMPFKNGKPDFHEVDFKTLYITHREIQKANKLARKILRYNKS